MTAGRRLLAGRGQAFVGGLFCVSGAAERFALDRIEATIAAKNFAARVFMTSPVTIRNASHAPFLNEKSGWQ